MVAICPPAGTESNCCCGIAFCWFDDDILFRKVFKQIANRFVLFDVREDESALGWNKAFQSRERFFEQGAFRNKAQQLLRTITPAQRPEPFAAAAGENEGIDRIRHVKSCQ